jgi:hypothetical protein
MILLLQILQLLQLLLVDFCRENLHVYVEATLALVKHFLLVLLLLLRWEETEFILRRKELHDVGFWRGVSLGRYFLDLDVFYFEFLNLFGERLLLFRDGFAELPSLINKFSHFAFELLNNLIFGFD